MRTIFTNAPVAATQITFKSASAKGVMEKTGAGTVTIHSATTNRVLATLDDDAPFVFDLGPGFLFYAVVSVGTASLFVTD